MNPFFITGFTDGEGSFTLSIRSSDKYTSKWKVQYAFQIGLHKKDVALLEKIQLTLGVGKLYTRGEEGYDRHCSTAPSEAKYRRLYRSFGGYLS